MALKRKPRSPKKKTRRDIMRDNNTLAREWMIKNGYTEVWLKQHTRHLDTVWSHNASPNEMELQVTKYNAQDIWNLFDGLAVNSRGAVTFLAIGIQFKKIKELEQFLKGKHGIHVLMIKINRKAVKVPVITVKEWQSN